MTRSLFSLVVLCVVLVCLGLESRARPHALIDPAPASTARWAPWTTTPVALPSPPPPLESWPDRCERVWWDEARERVRRVRLRWTDSDRREMRGWLGRVAAEFEPREARNLASFLRALASRESSYRTGAVHLLSEDRRAAVRAAERLSDGSVIWADARVVVWVKIEGELVPGHSENAWRFSRGLYGFPSALWLRPDGRWAEPLPPWALCDRRVSTTLLIWAVRDFALECERQGHPATWRTLNRRVSSGHCRERAPKFERAWTKRARDQGLDPDGAVAFDGRRWPEVDADRAALLALLRWL